MSFVIANDLLAPSTRAIELRISPWATIVVGWNNSENAKDKFFGMKHQMFIDHPSSPLENKWGAMVKAYTNKVLSKKKMCLG
jgi:hypothetical protein